MGLTVFGAWLIAEFAIWCIMKDDDVVSCEKGIIHQVIQLNVFQLAKCVLFFFIGKCKYNGKLVGYIFVLYANITDIHINMSTKATQTEMFKAPE